ncbi:MAG: hypothetical protein ACRC1X_00825 [Lactobacillus panisapium]
MPKIKRLKPKNEHSRQQNLKLTIEDEFIKIDHLVDQQIKNYKPRK